MLRDAGKQGTIDRMADGTDGAPRLLIVGGDDHHLRLPFILRLQERGFTVAAAGTGNPEPFRKNDITYFDYDFDRFVNPLADVSAIRKLRKIIETFAPDVVQTFDTKPGILVPVAARRAGNTKVVRTVNGLGWLFSTRAPVALALRPVFNLLHRVTAPFTSLTIFQNTDDLAHCKKVGIVGDKAPSGVILGSGVDVDKYEGLVPSDGEKLRRELELGDGPVVITVSRLSKIKGIPTLLEAAELVHKQRPDVTFLLVGSNGTEGKLAIPSSDLERHHPYVRALGQRSDVPELLAMADVFAFPTELFEGVPRVLLEAAMANVPIVTTAMPGCVDVVKDGESGFVVPKRRPDQLAAKIIEMLDDPERGKVMAERTRARVREHFSLQKVVDGYVDAYTRVMTPRAGAAQSEKSDSGSLERRLQASETRASA